MRQAMTTAAVAAAMALAAGAPVSAQGVGEKETPVAAPSAKAPEHRIATEPERLDLGWMRPSTTQAGTVTLRNTSDGVVNLLRVTSSCTCTVGELTDDQKILEPGESTELSLSLKSGANTGPMVQRAYVWYEGSRSPFEVVVQAEVSLPVKTDPTFVNLLGSSKTGKIRLDSLDGKPFRVTSVDGGAPRVFNLDGEPVDASEPGEAFLVEYDYTGIADADLDRWFMIETDHPEALELPLRVLHTSLYQVQETRPSWSFSKDRLILGRMRAGDSVERELALKAVNSPEDVTEVSVNSEGVDAEILDVRVEGRETIVKLRFVATGGEMGLIKTRVKLTVEGQSQEADVIVRVEEAS